MRTLEELKELVACGKGEIALSLIHISEPTRH